MVTNPDDAELVMVMGGSGEDRGASLCVVSLQMLVNRLTLRVGRHRMAGAQLEELCSIEVLADI